MKAYELGVLTSYSRPRVSNDNPFAEALFRTVKYAPSFPEHGFDSLDGARVWVNGFVGWYNAEHKHSVSIRPTPIAFSKHEAGAHQYPYLYG